MKRFLACFDEKPKPRNAEQLFRTYAELHFNETMGKGWEGRNWNAYYLNKFITSKEFREKNKINVI